MMMSRLLGVWRTCTPEYPSAASSVARKESNSALKIPSFTHLLFADLSGHFVYLDEHINKFYIPAEKN